MLVTMPTGCWLLMLAACCWLLAASGKPLTMIMITMTMAIMAISTKMPK